MLSTQLQTWTEQRKNLFLDRYAAKGKDGELIEHSPEEMWDRVATAISTDDKEHSDFLDILTDFKFVPGGRILAGAGVDAEVTPYNCFVIPVRNESKPEHGNDSREAIFDTRARMVNIMSRGGGVGINWSTLRPKGAHLGRVNGTTSGPVEWMNAASVDVGTVIQGGSRRGAAMFMLWDWHPDIEEFINHKKDQSKTLNANISVAVSDQFMQQVKNDGDWTLVFPDTTFEKYNSEWDGDMQAWILRGYPWLTYKTLKARDLWNQIISAAWASGEPGVVFLERYNSMSTAFEEEKIIAVNPCGEQGLGAYSVCNLASMNLDRYVETSFDTPGDLKQAYEVLAYGGKGSTYFNVTKFKKDVKTAIRFLDNVIDKAYYGETFKESEEQQMKLRRIGLGTMGLADALIKLGIVYGTTEAVEFTEQVYKSMKYAAIDASADLANERGPAPAWTPNKLARPFFGGFDNQKLGDSYRSQAENGIPAELFSKVQAYGMRNMFLLTQAPTGTTSLLAGVNSGIEPYFALELKRIDRTNPDGWDFMAPPLREHLAKGGNPDKLPETFVTTADLTEMQHIDMIAAAQKHIDSSISKTINAPSSATVEGAARAYMEAYDQGLKAVAYYRDGSRDVQVLNHKIDPIQDTEPVSVQSNDQNGHLNGNGVLKEIRTFRRGTTMNGTTRKYSTSVGSAFITVNRDDEGDIREVFVNVGKAGSDISQLSEALARLVSTGLQHGLTTHAITAQINGVGGFGKMRMSLPTAIAHAIEDAEADYGEPEPEIEYDEEYVMGSNEPILVPRQYIGQMCPNCQEFSVVHMNGCMECAYGCGYTAC